jgi:ribosome maturation factor RimP
MIDKVRIEKLVEGYLSGHGFFLVNVKVSSSNKITILADRKEGITIDECVAISRYIEKNLNRDEDDYELQVSSPGLYTPFIVVQQYYKNEGKSVEVTDIDGNRYSGLLKNVTGGGFELVTEVRVKGKPKETKDISFNYDQIKSTRPTVTFKIT